MLTSNGKTWFSLMNQVCCWDCRWQVQDQRHILVFTFQAAGPSVMVALFWSLVFFLSMCILYDHSLSFAPSNIMLPRHKVKVASNWIHRHDDEFSELQYPVTRSEFIGCGKMAVWPHKYGAGKSAKMLWCTVVSCGAEKELLLSVLKMFSLLLHIVSLKQQS